LPGCPCPSSLKETTRPPQFYVRSLTRVCWIASKLVSQVCRSPRVSVCSVLVCPRLLARGAVHIDRDRDRDGLCWVLRGRHLPWCIQFSGLRLGEVGHLAACSEQTRGLGGSRVDSRRQMQSHREPPFLGCDHDVDARPVFTRFSTLYRDQGRTAADRPAPPPPGPATLFQRARELRSHSRAPRQTNSIGLLDNIDGRPM
jgi:hypothetical protein